MKKSIVFFATICLAALYGCGGCIPGPEPDEPSVTIYDSELYVTFLDTNGKSLAAGLSETSEDHKYTWIKSSKYSLFHHFQSYCKGYPTHNLSYANNDLNDYTLKFCSSQPEEAPKYVRYDLQCKIIFGDDKFHVIESTYTTKSEECDYIYYCTSFTFDGKEYPVEEGGVVTVRLNTAEN